MAKRGPKLQFPDANKFRVDTQAVFCPADRVIGLFNEAHDVKMVRLSKTVREWFEQQSKARGWLVLVLPDNMFKYGAGYVMWPPQRTKSTTVKVERETLVLTVTKS